MLCPGNTKGGSITVPLTSFLTGLDYSVLQIKTKIVSCHTADFKPVKQEVNGTVTLRPLVFPALSNATPYLRNTVQAVFTILSVKPFYSRNLQLQIFLWDRPLNSDRHKFDLNALLFYLILLGPHS
jgi:hypothetical protein